MTSQFGWVDFDEKDRQKMLDVVRLFKERETRDELGIGTIRDAFADYFFPGTSTIQTRVRYMLFIPWIYLALEQRAVASDRIVDYARKREINLISSLMAGGETTDVIGNRSKARLKRLPSSIYWAGLKAWGIRRIDGHQDKYHRVLGRSRQATNFSHGNEGERVAQATMDNWDPGLPKAPENFLTETTFNLTEPEAHYLQDRIRLAHGQSLLAYLFIQQQVNTARFFWEHPLVATVPEPLQKIMTHARNFSEVIYGAALLYNFLLARKRGDDALSDFYETELEGWSATITAREQALSVWYEQLGKFWDCSALHQANIPALTRRFVEGWLELVFTSSSYSDLIHNQHAYNLIQNREARLKSVRARLTNQRALELWNGSSGNNQLDFRWRTATTMANDIIKALHPSEVTSA